MLQYRCSCKVLGMKQGVNFGIVLIWGQSTGTILLDVSFFACWSSATPGMLTIVFQILLFNIPRARIGLTPIAEEFLDLGIWHF